MMFNVYMTKEEYENWNKGEEVKVTNLPQTKEGLRGQTEWKMNVLVDEKEVLHVEQETMVQMTEPSVLYYSYIIKRENGPKPRYL